MDPSYVNVMKIGDLAYVMLVYAFHGAIAVSQLCLAGFLVVTGSKKMINGASAQRRWGVARLGLGLSLLVPAVFGASHYVSVVAVSLALVILLNSEGQDSSDQQPRSNLMQRLAIAIAALVALAILWEGEDNLVLGVDLLVNTIEFRDEEVGWQAANDPQSPKVGDVAPDFELQDPSGKVRVRLSDFRGKRPVALVFGSYT